MLETTPKPDIETIATSTEEEADSSSSTAPDKQISWIAVAIGLAACAAVLLALERYMGIYMPDDAYITYRYAENLAAGKGLVFNAAAQPVEGYSNLSWIILLAGLSKLGLDIPVW